MAWTSSSCERYGVLLARYYQMIWQEPWHDGRREALVRQMDPLWEDMTAQQRSQVMAESHRLYAIGPGGNGR
jgi:hypothetical protein